MIASGCIMWAKRTTGAVKQPASFGLRLVETWTLGTVLGLPLATAGYFYANRLLPVDLPGRAQWEIHSFFLCWLALLLLACWRREQSSWRFGCILLSCSFSRVLPLLNALTTAHKLVCSHWQQGQWALAGFELTCLLFALLFLLLARGPVNSPALRVMPSARHRRSGRRCRQLGNDQCVDPGVMLFKFLRFCAGQKLAIIAM